MKQIENCEVCFGRKFTLIEKVDRVLKFNIYKCMNCGLYFQNPMPGKMELEALYNRIYKKDYSMPLAEAAFEDYSKKQESLRFRQILKFMKRGTILDVGASTGFFVGYVNLQKGWKADGIEYSREAVRKAKKDFEIDLIQGEIGKVKTPSKKYDVVTMHSVLDHIPDLANTVVEVSKRTENHGYFIFSIQNIGSFEYMIYKFFKKPFAGFIFEHLYYLNEKTISMLLLRYDFKIRKITSRQFSPIKLPPKRPLIGLVTFIPKLFLEYTDFGGSFKKGNNLYVYAQKIESSSKALRSK